MVFRISLLLDILGSDGLVAGVGGVESAQGQADHPAHQGGDHSTENTNSLSSPPWIAAILCGSGSIFSLLWIRILVYILNTKKNYCSINRRMTEFFWLNKPYEHKYKYRQDTTLPTGTYISNPLVFWLFFYFAEGIRLPTADGGFSNKLVRRAPWRTANMLMIIY